MRLRNITGADTYIENSEYVVQDFKGQKGNWKDIFNNDNPIHIEVGMGKGRFLMDLAALNPQINYVGIEMYSSVLLRAVQKMEENPLDNLRFIRMDAREIEETFAKDEVDKIYLNFSDPWPKDRHAKRRLPSRQFLARFDKILKKDYDYPDYQSMPTAQTAQQTLRLLCKNWKSFFKSIKDWKKHKDKYH